SPDRKCAARQARRPAQAATAVRAGANHARAAVRRFSAALPGIAAAGRLAGAFHAANTRCGRTVFAGAPIRRATASPAERGTLVGVLVVAKAVGRAIHRANT